MPHESHHHETGPDAIGADNSGLAQARAEGTTYLLVGWGRPLFGAAFAFALFLFTLKVGPQQHDLGPIGTAVVALGLLAFMGLFLVLGLGGLLQGKGRYVVTDTDLWEFGWFGPVTRYPLARVTDATFWRKLDGSTKGGPVLCYQINLAVEGRAQPVQLNQRLFWRGVTPCPDTADTVAYSLFLDLAHHAGLHNTGEQREGQGLLAEDYSHWVRPANGAAGEDSFPRAEAAPQRAVAAPAEPEEPAEMPLAPEVPPPPSWGRSA
jgi:hypothetical protein